ncbi:MAG TPA: hypothetical protein VF883_22690 [Thermoanaerobaculia bacterium]|jgi:hypothetical protein
MKKTGQFSFIVAGALVLTSCVGMSAFGDSRHRNDSDWRDARQNDRYERRDDRRDDRDVLTGVVERVDHRRGVAFLRDRRGGRAVAVEMVRRNTRGVDLNDIRRGDVVTFIGDWKRGGVFEAWRIDDVDSGRGRGRRR